MVGEQDYWNWGWCPPPSSLDTHFCNDTKRATPCRCAKHTQGIIAVPPYNHPVPFRNNSRQVGV